MRSLPKLINRLHSKSERIQGSEMSIKAGNALFREGKFEQAISEYQKIGKGGKLFELAQFNIGLARNRQKEGWLAEAGTLKDGAFSAAPSGQPILSIVMPVFNVAPYLEASILSVLGQSLTDFELIIIDDASTDGSPEIIQFFANLDARIKFIRLNHNTLGGAGIPSNVGIRAAVGKYVGFVDSDDLVHKHAFRDMVAAAEKNSAEVVIGDFARFDQEYLVPPKAYDKGHWIDIPRNKVFDPLDATRVFRLSPVPWRKLYQREFLSRNGIVFAEGDFFYEDNPLHWFVLTRAKRVMLIDQVTSFHRMGRVGQTMGSNDYKFAAICMHMNAIRGYLTGYPGTHRAHWTELLDQIYRTDWIYQDVAEPKVKNLLRKLNAITCKRVLAESGVPIEEMNKGRPEFARRFEENDASRIDVDLTIIVPVYNAVRFLDGLLATLRKIRKITFDVIFIDDGSTDGSLEKCQAFAEKTELRYVFSQKNKGGGRARNAVIPLANGRFSYFFDADDVLVPEVLEQAVITAKEKNHDLYFMPYKLLRCKGSDERVSEMFPTDQRLWGELNGEADSSKYRKIVAGMGNYPWNRLIKTELLHDNNVFFGGMPVHNDIPFHWHSIAAAHSIGYANQVVCHHRLFEDVGQTTNISDGHSLHVFSALEDTYSILGNIDTFTDIFGVWKLSASKIVDWAEDVIQPSLREEFLTRRGQCLATVLTPPAGLATANAAPAVGIAA
jgi:glycosyltransferase involved in cell wall biosynthesis